MLSVCIRQIRSQLEGNCNNPIKLRKSQSQTDFHRVVHRNQSNEYPFDQYSSQIPSIINRHGEICSYPSSYGLFATFDQYSQPLSSTIKVCFFDLSSKERI